MRFVNVVSATVADVMVATLKASGVRRVYGIPGDSLNGFTDALRRDGAITWEHVRHEEAAGFAAAAEATLTGDLAVCAASCGPGNLHLVNGLFDANRSGVPVLAIAAHIPREEIGGSYFQETHPQELFRECSVYCELASVPQQLPRILEIAMRAALQRGGVAVIVVPGEVFLADALEAAPPYDVGMTGLIGFSSGYRAMEHCDALVMLGTDFSYRPFYPEGVPVIQVDVRGERIGRRVPAAVPLVGTVKDTLEALLPLLTVTSDSRHLDRMTAHYRRARARLDRLAEPGQSESPLHPQFVAATINRLAAEDAVFTADVGTPCIWAARYLRMNGTRRLIGSFNHGTMANALPHAIGAQASHPGRQVIALSGDGGLAMLLGEIITLRQQKLPVKIVVFNNGALSFVELEMKAAGIVTFGTDLDNPDFAGIARACGLYGQRVDKAGDLEGALRAAFEHDGAALVDVRTARYELSLPPKLTYSQIKGFTLYASRTILSGQGTELIELAKTNLRELAAE
jgi:pyruvate dehydrogenase (quinone)